MAGKDISFKITLENNQFKVSSKEAQDALKKIGIESEVAAGKGKKSTEGFNTSLGSLKVSTMAAVAGVATFAKGVYSLAASMVKNASAMQQNQVAFSTLLKSQEKAKVLIGDLQKWANKTPFGMEDATQGAKRLLAFGVEANKLTEVMTRLGDASMGNAQTFDTLTLAYGKMQSKGKVSLEELNMMTEAGVPIIDEMAKNYGVSTAALYKMVETGKVGFNEMDQALTELTTGQGQFAGMMDKQSATLGGVWSTFKDQMSQAAGTAGQELIPVLTETLLLLSDKDGIMNQITGLFSIFAKTIGLVTGALNYFIREFNDAMRVQNQQNAMNDQNDNYKKSIDALKQLTPGTRAYKEEVFNLQRATNDLIDRQKENIARTQDSIKENAGNATMLAVFNKQIIQAQNEIKRLNGIQDQYNKSGGIQVEVKTVGGKSYKPQGASAGASDKPEAKSSGSDWIASPDYSSKSFTSGMLSETQSVISQIDGIMQMATDNELARIDLRTQKKTDALNAEYAAEVERINNSSMSQKEKDIKLKALDEKRARDQKAIDDKAAKDKRKIEHEAAKRKKAMDIVNTVIAGAVGMIAAFQMGPIAGAVFAALIGALTVASVATIASQPLPPLAVGTNYIPQDMPAQLHKGEAVIPAKFNSDEYIKKDQAQATNLTVYQTINLDGKEIGQNVEQYLLNRAANMNTGIYNNQG